MTTPVKITSYGTKWPIGTIVTDENGTSWQMINETEAIPYIKPPPQRRFYSGSKGKPNRRILYINRRGTYYATKGWRL